MPLITCIEDYRRLARRRLPRMAFDFVDGGAAGESAVRRNEAAFERLTVRPRVLRACEVRSNATTLFGRSYAAPVGIAPIGLAGLAWPGIDLGFAALARTRDIPFILSTAATTAIEEVAGVASGNLWFQLYVGQDHAIVLDLVDRAVAAEVEVLVVTLDVPAPGKRLRDLRNGLTLPLKPGAGMLLDLIRHPNWSWAMMRRGAPRFANLERYQPAGASAASLAQFMAAQSSARLDLSVLRELRKRWPGKLVVKGLLHPDDARSAQDAGADAIVVSNHGGRQVGAAIAPIDALPAIRAAAGDAFPILLDGGIRSGEDVLLAIAAGADFTLLGRPFVFAAAARGVYRGPAEAFAMIDDEINRGLAQLGFASIDALRRGREDLMLVRDGA